MRSSNALVSHFKYIFLTSQGGVGIKHVYRKRRLYFADARYMALMNTGRCHARQHKIKKGGMTMSRSKNGSGMSDGTPRIKLDKANFMTDSGKSVQIVAKAYDLYEPIRWVSDNEAVATVDQTGTVTWTSPPRFIASRSRRAHRVTARSSESIKGKTIFPARICRWPR